jgi:hypothetical protein
MQQGTIVPPGSSASRARVTAASNGMPIVLVDAFGSRGACDGPVEAYYGFPGEQVTQARQLPGQEPVHYPHAGLERGQRDTLVGSVEHGVVVISLG